MLIATWNVNSIRARVDRVTAWLERTGVDVLVMQETKCKDAQFPTMPFEAIGYEVVHHGLSQWNGVAIASRVGIADVATSFEGVPGWGEPAVVEARALGATCGGVRVWSLYVPNGRTLEDPHYAYKLEWLAALRDHVAAGPEAVVVCGDLNIAPTDADVFDPHAYRDETHVTVPERAALAALQDLGLRDVVRDRWPGERVFSYWDYRAGMFHQNLGMRIDLVLAGAPVAARVVAAWIDREARKGTAPSDHAPVVVDLDDAPDGDIGPMVPPPSAAAPPRGRTRLPQAKD